MNLFEKLNRLDDSVVESRVVEKKKLTESVEDEDRIKEFLKSFFTHQELIEIAEAHTDFTGRTYKEAFDYVLNNWDNFYFEDEYEAFCEDDYDDIDEMLTESDDSDNFLKQIREATKSYARITASDYGVRLVSLEDDLASYINRDKFNKYVEDCLNNNMSIDDIVDDIPWEKTISVHHAFEAEEYNQNKRRLNREYGFTKERTKSNRTPDTTPKLTFTELKKQNAEIVPYIKECVSLLERRIYTKSIKVLSRDCCIVMVTITGDYGLKDVEKTIQPLAKRFPGEIDVTWGRDCADWRLSRFNIKMTLTKELTSDYDDYDDDIDEMLTESVDPSDALKLRETSDADVIFYGYQYKNNKPVEITPEELSSEEYEDRINQIVDAYNRFSSKGASGNRYGHQRDFIFYALYKK